MLICSEMILQRNLGRDKVKIFCITGAFGQDLDAVADILSQVGIKNTKLPPQNRTLGLSDWHDRLIGTSDVTQTSRPNQPGKLWEHLASNIFLENMALPMWSWADSRSTWLLDFWQQFEPNINFLLVYVSPQRAFANALSTGNFNANEIDSFHLAWLAHYQEILRFHYRHPQRTLLVDVTQCIAQPQALVAACAEHWQQTLSIPEKITSNDLPPSPLSTYFADQICLSYPKLQELHNEVSATLRLLDGMPPPLKQTTSLHDAIVSYDSLFQRGQSIAELEQKLDAANMLQQNNSELLIENEQLSLELKLLQQAHSKKTIEIEQLNDKARWQLQSIAESTSAQFEQDKTLRQLQKSHDDTINQLHQLQNLHDHTLQQTQQTLESSNQKILQLEQDNHALQASRSNLIVVQQEIGLLQLQVQGLQEELNQYFTKFKKSAHENQELLSRWGRLIQRNPNYHDYHAFDLLSLETSRSRQHATWHLLNLSAAGQIFEHIEFSTVLSDGKIALVFHQVNLEQTHTSLHCLSKVGGVTIAPDAAECVEVISQLSTSARSLINAICLILFERFESNLEFAEGVAQELDRDAWLTALANFYQTLRQQPPNVSFDRVSLVREQVNPDYEHLWIALENFCYQERHYPSFQFRLSCGGVKPNHFGTHPKLEFPADVGATPFEKWFDESYDDFGSKLELRFALPNAMDITVWNIFSAQDQTMVRSLISSLPNILAQLENSPTSIARPWQDWRTLASNIQLILIERVGDRLLHTEVSQTQNLTADLVEDQAKPHETSPSILGRSRKDSTKKEVRRSN